MFEFLSAPTGFEVLSTPGSVALGYDGATASLLDLFLVGVINTAVAAGLGLLGARLLATPLAAVARAANPAVGAAGRAVVALIRSTPPLLLLFVWFLALAPLGDLGLGALTKPELLAILLTAICWGAAAFAARATAPIPPGAADPTGEIVKIAALGVAIGYPGVVSVFAGAAREGRDAADVFLMTLMIALAYLAVHMSATLLLRLGAAAPSAQGRAETRG